MIGKGAPVSTTLGQLGSRFINDTTSFTGSWGVIYCISACVFDTLTPGTLPDGSLAMLGTTAQITMSPGMAIYGYWTTIKLTSGAVIAYNV